MIQLTKDIAMIADDHCYSIGRPRQRKGRAVTLKDPKYYSTVDKAVQGALNWAMRMSVADGSITTLREFIDEQERLKSELQKLVEPLK